MKGKSRKQKIVKSLFACISFQINFSICIVYIFLPVVGFIVQSEKNIMENMMCSHSHLGTNRASSIYMLDARHHRLMEYVSCKQIGNSFTSTRYEFDIAGSYFDISVHPIPKQMGTRTP